MMVDEIYDGQNISFREPGTKLWSDAVITRVGRAAVWLEECNKEEGFGNMAFHVPIADLLDDRLYRVRYERIIIIH